MQFSLVVFAYHVQSPGFDPQHHINQAQKVKEGGIRSSRSSEFQASLGYKRLYLNTANKTKEKVIKS